MKDLKIRTVESKKKRDVFADDCPTKKQWPCLIIPEDSLMNGYQCEYVEEFKADDRLIVCNLA